MSIYYGRFRHLCDINGSSEKAQEDLMGFFEIGSQRKYIEKQITNLIEFSEIDSQEEYIKKQIIGEFEDVFIGEFGKYGRSYVLRDFGKVIAGKGRLVQEEAYTNSDLEKLAEKAFE